MSYYVEFVFATQLYVSLVPNTASSEGIIQPAALPHVPNHVPKNSKFCYQLILYRRKCSRIYFFTNNDSCALLFTFRLYIFGVIFMLLIEYYCICLHYSNKKLGAIS